MSVMLTATKGALRKKSASPRAKSAPKKQAASTSQNKRTAAKPAAPSGPHVSAQNIKMWEFVFNSEPMTCIFRKDTMEIWLNDEKVSVKDSFSEEDDGAVLAFTGSSMSGKITTCRNEVGELEQVLSINGIIVE